jgi:3-hydroxyisobutyrate dehydrogenase-like beta-hydroxyacid dehydrogenase
VIVGLLHPGEMGAAVGAALRRRGHDVLWASAGRSADTARRAAEAGLEDTGSVEELAARSEVVLSICPPHAAAGVARSVDSFEGIYVDANAVSPATSRRVEAELPRARYVDGGIVGSPPRSSGDSRLYLSGDAAGEVAALFRGGELEPVVLPGGIGAASALKMAYAAWTKGSAALLMAARATARAEGIEDALLAEWARSIPELEARSERAAASAAAKGWRWVGEMEEIADTFGEAGEPRGFHEAAAEIYRRFG